MFPGRIVKQNHLYISPSLPNSLHPNNIILYSRTFSNSDSRGDTHLVFSRHKINGTHCHTQNNTYSTAKVKLKHTYPWASLVPDSQAIDSPGWRLSILLKDTILLLCTLGSLYQLLPKLVASRRSSGYKLWSIELKVINLDWQSQRKRGTLGCRVRDPWVGVPRQPPGKFFF